MGANKMIYLDENDFIKKLTSLKKYFKKTYNYYMHEVMEKLRKPNKIDGIYSLELPTDDIVKRVYGAITLQFSVKHDIAILEDLKPSELLLEGYSRVLPIYKGIPYRDKKDLSKIKLIEKMIKEINYYLENYKDKFEMEK